MEEIPNNHLGWYWDGDKTLKIYNGTNCRHQLVQDFSHQQYVLRKGLYLQSFSGDGIWTINPTIFSGGVWILRDWHQVVVSRHCNFVEIHLHRSSWNRRCTSTVILTLVGVRWPTQGSGIFFKLTHCAPWDCRNLNHIFTIFTVNIPMEHLGQRRGNNLGNYHSGGRTIWSWIISSITVIHDPRLARRLAYLPIQGGPQEPSTCKWFVISGPFFNGRKEING